MNQTDIIWPIVTKCPTGKKSKEQILQLSIKNVELLLKGVVKLNSCCPEHGYY